MTVELVLRRDGKDVCVFYDTKGLFKMILREGLDTVSKLATAIEELGADDDFVPTVKEFFKDLEPVFEGIHARAKAGKDAERKADAGSPAPAGTQWFEGDALLRPSPALIEGAARVLYDQKGIRYTSEELVRAVTGEAASPQQVRNVTHALKRAVKGNKKIAVTSVKGRGRKNVVAFYYTGWRR